MERASFLAAILVGFAMTPHAATALPVGLDEAMGPEQAMLDGYLRPYDRYPNLPYCGRVAPAGEPPEEAPSLPARHVNGTNRLMDEHMAWHMRHVRLAQTSPPDDDNNTYGDDFVLMHRMTVLQYDAWRVAHGHPELDPWDPATPIPARFRYELPDGCQSRNSSDPAVPLPAWLTAEGGGAPSPIFGYAKLCEFPTMNRLGKELDEGAQDSIHEFKPEDADSANAGYHTQVHNGVGGDMNQPIMSMRDPVFWAWHKFLDTRVQLWERECAGREPILPKMYMDGMTAMPGTHERDPAAARAPDERAQARAPVPAPATMAALALAAGLRARKAR